MCAHLAWPLRYALPYALAALAALIIEVGFEPGTAKVHERILASLGQIADVGAPGLEPGTAKV